MGATEEESLPEEEGTIVGIDPEETIAETEDVTAAAKEEETTQEIERGEEAVLTERYLASPNTNRDHLVIEEVPPLQEKEVLQLREERRPMERSRESKVPSDHPQRIVLQWQILN